MRNLKRNPKYRYIDIFRYWNTDKLTELKCGKKIENWYVQNTTTWKAVRCTSEEACRKIIRLALAELNEEPDPLKHVKLEQKAGRLIDW